MRALYRGEAELLVADADAMRERTYSARTPEHRLADAFAFVLLRFTDAVGYWGRGAAVAPKVRPVPARKRKRRSRGR
jgi:hypothetical protein